jgi:hypothetical protein
MKSTIEDGAIQHNNQDKMEQEHRQNPNVASTSQCPKRLTLSLE